MLPAIDLRLKTVIGNCWPAYMGGQTKDTENVSSELEKLADKIVAEGWEHWQHVLTVEIATRLFMPQNQSQAMAGGDRYDAGGWRDYPLPSLADDAADTAIESIRSSGKPGSKQRIAALAAFYAGNPTSSAFTAELERVLDLAENRKIQYSPPEA